MSASSSFTAVGSGSSLSLAFGDSVDFSLSGTYAATVQFEWSEDGKSWTKLFANTAANQTLTGTWRNEQVGRSSRAFFRWSCVAFTSGTAVATILDAIPARAIRRVIQAAGLAKVGGTAGWASAPADNLSLCTLPASQTGSKLILPIPQIKEGDVIYAFHGVGQIESAGATATLDMDLRKQTAAAADVTDASLGTITQLSVASDAIIGPLNSRKVLVNPEVATIDANYYIVFTGTTAALTDIALMGAVITVVEA